MPDFNDILRHGALREPLPRFARIASDMVHHFGLEKTGGRGPRGEAASDRVIRDYVHRRVLSPTITDTVTGERGLYGFRHLIEFLAARVLLNDGWTLDRIAERLRPARDDELLTMLPGSPEPNRALFMAQSLKLQPQTHPSFEASSSLETAARRRSELPFLMRRIARPGERVEAQRTVSIRIGGEVTVMIDSRRAERLSPEDAEDIGRAVTAALINLPSLTQTKERSK